MSNETASAPDRTWFEVFARHTTSDFLSHLGSVEAGNRALAEVRAVRIYDEHAWLEMCVVPRDACTRILPLEHRHDQIGVC